MPRRKKYRRRKRRKFNESAFIIVILLIVFGIYILSKFRQSKEVPYREVAHGKPIAVFFTRYDDAFGQIIHLIRSSKNTFYGAFFEIDNMEIAKELVKAKRRGVDVKLVSDEMNKDEKGMRYLLSNGIEVVFDNRDAYMHNKFAIVDGEIVLTGSANLTDNGMFFNDNNVVIVRSRKLAENYTKEFMEMFYDKLFGRTSPRNTHCCFLIGNIRVENYFAPEDRVSSKIVKLIRQAGKEIYVMAFAFTHDRIGDALVEAVRRGVEVNALFEKRGVRSKYSEYAKLKRAKANVFLDRNPKIMHNKVFIIDDSIVITGSYNFSNNADRYNDENVLIIFSKEIAQRYEDYFWKLVSTGK